MSALDKINIKILQLLQQDASIPQRELAATVGLSQNACWRRIKSMKDDGVIMGETIILNPEKLGLSLTVFVMIKTRQHSDSWLEKFRNQLLCMPQIVDFYRIAGEYDYMIKVVAKDMNDFDLVYKDLIRNEALVSVTSHITMEKLANNRALPIS